MTADIFAIWKFKNIEGLIECNGYDFQTTKIKKGLETYFIKYNLKTEEATIEKAYPNIFVVKYEENERNVTYSYTDVLTRTVEVDVFDGENYYLLRSLNSTDIDSLNNGNGIIPKTDNIREYTV